MKLSKPITVALAIAFVAIVAVLSAHPWTRVGHHNGSVSKSTPPTPQQAAAPTAPVLVPIETPEQHEKKKAEIKAEMQRRFEEEKAKRAVRRNGNSAL